ncbi:MAG: hypothetical protein EPO31_04030 [Gammaproteobacteria bacterium]|jgi:nitrate reductase assembly molybdenum cofactor insertion protein NarJ|nr:MAG: hypothetical protein EPO31_04030 [Gammaproteobacteria bacterium]
MKLRAHYQSLADLFEYPDIGYPARVIKLTRLLDGNYDRAAAELEQFIELLPSDDLRAMQELYTRTFDIQAITTLDIGYVLFGDDYKRGELLANLTREHRQVNNDCRQELADHLPNILRLIGKLKQDDLLDELIDEIVAPAVAIMIREFNPDQVDRKNENYLKHYKTLLETPSDRKDVATLYRHALNALYAVLKQDFSFTEKTRKMHTSDFLRLVTRENEIEAEANHA